MTLTTNCELYHTFDNGDYSAPTLVDKTSNGRDGTNSGCTTGVAGKLGECFSFDGVDNNVSLGSYPDASSAFTVTAWINTDIITGSGGSGPEGGTVFDNETGSTKGILIRRDLDALFIAVNDAGNRYTATTSSFLTINTWYFITIVYDGSDVRVYYNGSGNKIADFAAASHVADTSGGVIGRHNSLENEQGFDGKIDEFSVWSRALSTDEIDELYNNGDGLVYPFGEGVINEKKGEFPRRVGGAMFR